MHSTASQKNFLIKCHKTNLCKRSMHARDSCTHPIICAVSFSPSVTDQWNKLSIAMQNVDDTKAFKNSMFEFYRDFY